ncbi:asparagine--tRNA ligase [bacterium]|nr:MAG: asparagine--tRNA ligase [bacterium]
MWVRIEDIGEYEGKEVEIRGWLFNSRSSGKIHFILIRDGTGIIQGVVVKGEVPDDVFELADELTQESSIIVRGIVRKDPRAPGGYELGVKDIKLVHLSESYPITPKSHGVAFLMERRHLWIRSRKQNAILRIRAEVVNAAREFLNKEGFLLVDAPIFTPSACEGTTTLFEVDYFGRPAYLSQSGQLYMEAACMAFGKVYCLGPCFRAEKSKTRRHLTEFWQIEPEIAYADINDAMEVAERLVACVVERVLERRKRELEMLERNTEVLEKIKVPFPRISYDEAVKILKEKGMDIEWGEDFGAPHETELANSFSSPFFVHRYPKKIKAFYMKEDPDNPELSLSFDMLAPEGYGEIIGGGQREERLEKLKESIKRHNLPESAFEWYLDLRRYGTVPHAGFGLGIERTVAWICGIHHVREAIPFPRMLDTLYP